VSAELPVDKPAILDIPQPFLFEESVGHGLLDRQDGIAESGLLPFNRGGSKDASGAADAEGKKVTSISGGGGLAVGGCRGHIRPGNIHARSSN